MEDAEILRILLDSNFWKQELETGVRRSAYLNELKRLLKAREIVVVTGVRRSGKSTLLLQFFKDLIENNTKKEDTLIINFEDPRFKDLNLDLLNKIYELYLTELNPSKNHFVILDEIQVIDGWEKFARYLHENKKVNVFVTGSSSKLLSSEYSTVLAGRHVDMELYPLSFAEFLEFNKLDIKSALDMESNRHKIMRLLSEYFKWGGFPKIAVTKTETEKRTILQVYFRDIVIKDIVRRYKIKEISKLEELAKYYLTNVSTLQSFNSVRKFLGMNLDTVERFSYYMSNACFVYFTKKFSYSKKEQIANPRKVYCIDCGLRNAVAFVFSKDMGRIAENIVFNELKRKDEELYYWKGEREVDFVIKKPDNSLTAINVTYTDKPDEREIKGLKEFRKKFKKTRKLVIITKNRIGKEQGIYLIPLWKWLLENNK